MGPSLFLVQELSTGLRAAAAANLILLIALFIRHFRREHWVRFVLLFCLGMFAYVLYPLLERLEAPFLIKAVFFFLFTSLPFGFWMMARSFFTDLFVPAWHHWLAWGLSILATFIAFWPERLQMFSFIPASEGEKLRLLVPGIFYLSMIILGMAQAIPRLKSDMADKSDKFPVYFLLVGGTIMFVIINTRIIFGVPSLLKLHQAFALTLIWLGTTVVAVSILRFEDFFKYYNNSDASYQLDKALLERLSGLFENEKIYLTPSITVRQVASRLEVPDYKIRRLINLGLHYRNFNDYVNRFRIQDACDTLANPEQRETAITRIALDLGYKSLGPFNKAFKELKGMTPSEYREKKRRKQNADYSN